MSRNAAIELKWGDGTHTFRLPIGQLRELEEKRHAGPFQIYQRLVDRSFRVDDAREVVRLGLIGGGMQPKDAATLVEQYIDRWPLLETVSVAFSVLEAALVGAPDEPVGKEEAGEATAASDSPASTV